LDVEATFNAWVTDGIQINITNADATNTYYVTVTLFTGSDIASLYVNEYDDLGTGTSPINITDMGSQADLVFGLTGGSGAATVEPPPLVTHSSIAFGAWSRNDATQKHIAFESRNGADPSEVATYVDTNQGLSRLNTSTQDWALTFGTHASGFTVTPSVSGGTDIFFYMGIRWSKTPSVELIDVTLPASATDYVETGFSFKPQFGMLGLSNHTSADAADSGANCSFALSVIESGQVITTGMTEDDNNNTVSDSCSFSDTDLLMLDSDATTVLHEGPLQSLDANGWTFDISGTHDSTARVGWGLAIRSGGLPSFHGANRGIMRGVARGVG